jgi:hypothetical protein
MSVNFVTDVIFNELVKRKKNKLFSFVYVYFFTNAINDSNAEIPPIIKAHFEFLCTIG